MDINTAATMLAYRQSIYHHVTISIGIPPGNSEAIQHGVSVDWVIVATHTHNHVVGVVCIVIWQADITGEDGLVGLPVAGPFPDFHSVKTTIKLYVRYHHKRIITAVTGPIGIVGRIVQRL